jgi:hypothetical protein
LLGKERIGGLLKEISSDGGHALTENFSGQTVLFGVVPVVVMGRPKASNIVSAYVPSRLEYTSLNSENPAVYRRGKISSHQIRAAC